MNTFNQSELKQLYLPSPSSHKGQNGKLLIIGGSHLFHAASLWALEIASKIVDMVFYSSVPENEAIVLNVKEQFRNGIVVPRDRVEEYVREADCVLIGPGMVRAEREKVLRIKYKVLRIQDAYNIEDEGEQTYYVTKYLLDTYPEKKWVIDAGALQMMDSDDLKRLGGHVIITPHRGEFERVFKITMQNSKIDEEITKKIAKEYNCIILLKGQTDIACSPTGGRVLIPGGNAGMTKGGTGDILAGLTAALACNNDMFLAAKAASFFNKKAGESLFQKVGYYFNASDLLHEIPYVIKQFLTL